MQPHHISFYSAWFCPFAQRTWMALEHLEIPYIYQEIDPYDKTEKWLEISRGKGLVPVLIIESPDREMTRIPDSLRTMEYLDDAGLSSRSLFPPGPAGRAEARFWLDHQSDRIIPQFYRFLKAPKASDAGRREKNDMVAGLAAFAGAMSGSGPYFFGLKPGIVDFAFAPFAVRIEIVLAHYKDFRLPATGDNWRRYTAWWQAMKSLPAVKKSMPQAQTYQTRLLDSYLHYSLGDGQTDQTEPT